ncbi:hypothetical protein [Roseivirga thermotolerans]|jgi:hypothetical protein|uniref:hypothetical protein n=1 Tax=Roseivirga thermotolerans TaxID=1758176 RepID=UPI00273DF359|nr:hypothetical protein [Roseivirga thermotolerans]
MKKLLITVGLLASISLNAQWTDSGVNLTTTDIVGIGTVSPSARLDILNGDLELMQSGGTLNNSRGIIKFGENDIRLFAIQYDGTQSSPGNKLLFRGSTGSDDSYNLNFMSFSQTGYVGIGNIEPREKLELSGNFRFGNSSHQYIHFAEVDGGDGFGILFDGSGSGNDNMFHITGGAGNVSSQNKHLTIRRNTGFVGLGTISPNERLEVNGNALIQGSLESKKVKVTATPGSVPDYVFDKDYRLKSLSEVEEFIKANSHLPNIPNSKEIETNGQDVGYLQLKLLEKIEELTLYMIEQNKEMVELKRTVKSQAEKIKILESRSSN